MRYHAITPIVGRMADPLNPDDDPTVDPTDALGRYAEDKGHLRSLVAQYTGNYQDLIPQHMTTGAPLFAWTLAVFDVRDIEPFKRDARIYVLPECGLSTTWGSVAPTERQALRAKLNALGVVQWPFADGSISYRRMIEWIGQQLAPAFRADYFNVPEA